MSAAPSRQVRLVGPFQQLVMIALVRLGPDTSACDVRRHIEHRTGRRISITAVHTTLQRLGARGYTRSWTRPIFRDRPRVDRHWWKTCPSSLLRNAARRFHTLQTLGRRALRLTLSVGDVLRAGLPGLGREAELYQQWSWNGMGSRLAGRPLNRRTRKRIEKYGLVIETDEQWEQLLSGQRIELPPQPAAVLAWMEAWAPTAAPT